MSKKVEVVEEVTIEGTHATVEPIEVAVLEETFGEKSKAFMKKQLPKVGYLTAGVVIGVVVSNKTNLLKNVNDLNIIEGISELGD